MFEFHSFHVRTTATFPRRPRLHFSTNQAIQLRLVASCTTDAGIPFSLCAPSATNQSFCRTTRIHAGRILKKGRLQLQLEHWKGTCSKSTADTVVYMIIKARGPSTTLQLLTSSLPCRNKLKHTSVIPPSLRPRVRGHHTAQRFQPLLDKVALVGPLEPVRLV